MPKMKTNKAAAARFKVKKSGKVKRWQQNTTHILTKMTQKRKRQLKGGSYVDSSQERTIKRLIQG